MKREIRTFRGSELRAQGPSQTEDKKVGSIEGYAAVFNSAYEVRFDNYVFREVIKPGAFARALKEKQDVRCLVNHDDNQVLGRTKSGTLELSQDSKGLKYSVTDLPDTTIARDLHTSVMRGDIDGCSFQFVVRKDKRGQEKLDDGSTIFTREIEDLDLYDVGPVTFPAYESTSVEARSLFPDGVPAELLEMRDAPADCPCECPECINGNCAACSDEKCSSSSCMHEGRSAGSSDQESTESFKARHDLRLKIAERV
jgi:HK97 family phage prohead protease